jgi:ATP-binding cassette subfamily B protein
VSTRAGRELSGLPPDDRRGQLLCRTTVPSSRRSPWTYLKTYRGSVISGALSLVATSALALAVPWLLGLTVEALRGDDPAGEIPILALAMVGFALAQAVARIASRILLFNAARMAEYDLRSDLFGHLLQQAPSFYRSYTVGDVMSRLTADVQTVRAMWGPGVLNIVNTSFLFTAAVILMISIDWQLALWALVPYPLMVLLGRAFAGRLFRESRAVQEYLGTVSSSVQEDLSGIGVIKTHTVEPQRERRFRGMAGARDPAAGARRARRAQHRGRAVHRRHGGDRRAHHPRPVDPIQRLPRPAGVADAGARLDAVAVPARDGGVGAARPAARRGARDSRRPR